MAEGLLNKASIILTPTGYKAGTLYNVAPINEPYEDFDFARTSTATRINSSGLVSNVATGVPRINYVKGSIVNLLTYSEDLPQIFDAFNTQETYPYSTSPIGTTTSTSLSLIPRDLGVAGYLYTTSDLTQGQTYTFSCYYKGTSGESVYMRARALGSEDNSKEITFNGSWQREEITFVSGTSDTMYIVDTTLGGGSESGFFTFEVWGAQLELGSEATQYAPSFGSPGHRYDNGHILLEPTSTNLIPYSEDFSQSTWGKTRCEITANQAISPDGTLNADLMTATDDDARLEDVVASSGIIVTQSIYVKSATGGNVSGQIDFAGLDVVSFTANNDWQRVETTLSDTNISPRLRIRITNDGDSLYVWGAQVEELPYATSYIPTLTGSQEVRETETATGAGSADLINSTEGVLYAEIAALANDGTNRCIALSDGSVNDRISLIFGASSDIIRVLIKSDGSTSFDEEYEVTSTLDYHKVAMKYKANDFAMWIDGVERFTDTSGSAPIGLNQLTFDVGSGILPFYGKCKALAVFNEALSDAELNNLTG